MEDAKIVDLYWARKENAIDESRSKYGRQCRGIAFNILHNSEDTDECENDTYLRAWNSMPSQRPSKLGAFLSRITRNLSLDRLDKRKAAKRGGGTAELVLGELCDCIPDQSSEGALVTDDELAHTLDTFLETLSPQARKFFLQRYWTSCSIEEIAQRNNATAGKAKMSLHRSRKALQKHLEQRGLTV